MLRALLASTVIASTTAAASPLLQLGARNLELGSTRDIKPVSPDEDEIVDTSGDPYVRFAGFAQLAAGSDQQLRLGGAAAVSGVNCRLVEASAQAHLRAATDDPIGGIADATVCPFNYVVSFHGEGHAALGIAPNLGDRSDRWRRRYDEVSYKLGFGIGEFFDATEESPSRHSGLHVGVGYGVTRQLDEGERAVMKSAEIFGTLYRYRYFSPTISITVDGLAVSSKATKHDIGDLGSVVTTLDALKLELATTHVVISARGGLVKTGGRVTASGGSGGTAWMETYDASGLPELRGFGGEISIGGRGRGIEVLAHARRSVYPTIDGNLAREDHASASIAITRRAVRAVLAPFLARTQTWIRSADTDKAWTGGASLEVGRDVMKHVRLDAIVIAGVSPYASVEGARAPTNEVGGQALLVLTASAGI